MVSELNPHIGEWYKNPTGETFEIVARDDDDDTLELQYFDGTVEELDRDVWDYLEPSPIEPPEDWRGCMDIAQEALDDQNVWLDHNTLKFIVEGQ